MAGHRIFSIPLAEIYPHYLTKAAKQGRGQAEVDQVICWLTGYDVEGLHRAVEEGTSLEDFFDQAPAMNPDASLITGVICGHRVEEITDPLMQQIRWMDKLVDEVGRGKKMESILRSPKP
ncbi:DUF2200 domain-containing protein [Luteococcus peritonei]|uniref:DUF2200 domain-containing protein n=1 Tax=Luteococcus peritonei TaxID=88874 RepID=A0ABW4RXT3_9ACTN